jgi:hypothetical protein
MQVPNEVVYRHLFEEFCLMQVFDDGTVWFGASRSDLGGVAMPIDQLMQKLEEAEMLLELRRTRAESEQQARQSERDPAPPRIVTSAEQFVDLMGRPPPPGIFDPESGTGGA